MRLLREVRCFADPGDGRKTGTGDGGEAFWACRAMVTGPVDRRTGYVFDIKRIDALVRDSIVPDIQGRLGSSACPGIAATLPAAFDCAAGHFVAPVKLDSLEVAVSPFLRFSVRRGSPDMVQVTRSFEFCAAHRLFCRDFSDEENRRTFGPCSNSNWHGHNYVLEVTVGGVPNPTTGLVIDGTVFEGVVHERAIAPFDHKNLNLECQDFRELNPSVENIARVLWSRLEGAFGCAQLRSVRVWETSKTCAEYAGD